MHDFLGLNYYTSRQFQRTFCKVTKYDKITVSVS